LGNKKTLIEPKLLNSCASVKSGHLVATHATPQLRDDLYRRQHTLRLQAATSHHQQHTAQNSVLDHKEKKKKVKSGYRAYLFLR